MAKCYFEKTTNSGNEIWGKWVCHRNMGSMQDNMIKFCRRAFGNKYRDYWINPVYFDDKYFVHTQKFFSEVGVLLYPKLSRAPKMTDENRNYYNAIIFNLAMEDISTDTGVEPLRVIVKGVRYRDKKNRKRFIEKVTSVKEVGELEGVEYNY